MRVLHVITGLGAGGAERQLEALLRHQPDSQVATLTNPGVVARAMRGSGTTVHDLRMRSNRDVGVVPRLVRLMRAGRFDVVHAHLYRACVYARLAARLAGVPRIVATEHSLGADSIEGRRTTRSIRAGYLASERLGHLTVAVSKDVAERLRAWGVPASRIATVHNGIDPQAWQFDELTRCLVRSRHGFADNDYVIGGVGRLVADKRFDLLVRAAAGISGAVVLLVGDGPLRGPLVALARTLGVRLVVSGEVDDVRGELCAMDGFAAPSATETFGLAILEALSCGLSVHFTVCPALWGVHASQAPGAHLLPADPRVYRAALLSARGTPRRLPPPIVHQYDIRCQARRLEAMYRRETMEVDNA